jgi:hypothetical protein
MRTDIPAFHHRKFLRQLEAGNLEYTNPYTKNRYSIKRDDIDCIVFWSKNYEHLIPKLHILDSYGIKYYFQFTINGYPFSIEPNVPDVMESVRQVYDITMHNSNIPIIWRYDPIIITKEFTPEWHVNHFDFIADQLCILGDGAITQCTISFVDMYNKTKNAFKDAGIEVYDYLEVQKKVACDLSDIAKEYGIEVSACCEDSIRFNAYGDELIKKAHCIDPELITKLIGKPFEFSKSTSRKECGCVKTVDIGEYGTCQHSCIYCYAK